MAAPSYTTDLTDITLAENTTNWSRYGAAGNPGSGSDFAMQGTFAVDKQVSNGDGGVHFNNGSGITLGTGDHVFVWHFAATPGITQTIQNKGASIMIGTGAGTTLTNACEYHVAGNDTYGASGRVAICYPIDYTVRTNNTSAPYRTVTGTPGANPQYFGGGIVTTATARTNLGIDAIRYGTGAYLTAGELTSAGDGSDNPCTFAGFNTQNDSSSNRWGILTDVGGSYELQGIFAIGQNNAGTATLARFEDSDVNIVVADTIHAASTFNRFVIDHASTVCNWNNINITALGTTSRGSIEVQSNNPTFDVTGGTWTQIGAVTLRSNTTLDGTILRQTDLITGNGATITNCVVDRCRNAVSITTDGSNVSNITDTTFISDGSNHALEITGTASTFTLTGLIFTSYDAGSAGSPVTPTNTGNEAVYVNIASGTVTLNVSGGTTPSVRSAGATVNVVSSVTVTLTGLQNPSEVRVFNQGTTTEVAGTGSENVTTGTHNFSVGSGVAVDISILSLGYQNLRILNYSTTADATLPISQVLDRQYANP